MGVGTWRLWLLLWLSGPPSSLAAGPPGGLVPAPCNDRVVEKLSRLAVTYVNEDREEGYKFALDRVANVHLHAQGPAGSVYYLDLDVLETKCHVRSPKPWKRCDVRPFMETQIAGNCNTTILHTVEGFSYLYSYDCTLVPDPPEQLQQTCPSCPLLLPLDSPQAEAAAHLALRRYKQQSIMGANLGLKDVTRAAAQNVDPSQPIQPQLHDLNPSVSPFSPDPGFDPQDLPMTPNRPQPVRPTPPPFCSSSSSSSSESSETKGQTKTEARKQLDSSEELIGVVALRPPFNFRYRTLRRKRQSLLAAPPPHTPLFLSDFPSGPSPFRSCPGPSRYTTT
ncbi:alpha-2-HS-glycoprotein 1 [Aplochiton taeniatus]